MLGHILAAFAIVALIVGSAGLVAAQSTPGGAGPQIGGGPPAALPPSPSGTAESPRLEQGHRIIGQVTRIDVAGGTVTLRTDEGQLELKLPRETLSGLKVGERVEVQVDIRPTAFGPSSPSKPGR
ncbi:MAG TPA: hypothetical protein VGX21_07820 [Methylomirabilota bacterium]|nr:hypothetical protein [Methylomirabilota bacterium]